MRVSVLACSSNAKVFHQIDHKIQFLEGKRVCPCMYTHFQQNANVVTTSCARYRYPLGCMHAVTHAENKL